MLIQQTHFPRVGPNWEKIALITLGAVIIGILAYHAIKPIKLNKTSAPEPDPIDTAE
jgi:hypothetical protein